MLRRFDRERELLARMHHTNIVPIFATGQEGDLLYFAMQYIEGASLGQIIRAARSHGSDGGFSPSTSFEELVREAMPAPSRNAVESTTRGHQVIRTA